jgi:ribosomal protein S24E
MKFNVIEEKENPLLKRKELLLSIDYEGGSTPSKADMQKFLSEQLNANIENLEISKVLSEMGMARGKAWVKIWEEKKIELYSKKKKAKPETEQASQPEAQPQEKKAEEAKEEAKQEKQKEESKPEEPQQEQPTEEKSE